MSNGSYYGCGRGCRGCPRLRQCMAEREAVSAMAEADITDGDVWGPAKEYADLPDFLADNPERGFLRVQAFRGDQAVPLPEVRVTVYKELADGRRVFFEGVTDGSGVIDGIELPAPGERESQQPGEPNPYATYGLLAERLEFEPLETTVDIFQSVKTVQPVQLRLRME